MKIAIFKTVKIGLGGSFDLHTKKAPQKVLFIKWCAILCTYRTENYDDYKQLDYKLELLLDQNEQQKTNNLQLLLA